MPTVGPAFRFLEDHAQEMFGEIRSMMYVGHRGDTHPWWRTTFAERLGSPALDVCDIEKGNLGTAQEFARHLIHGDVRTLDIRGYGLVFWDEGPEHVTRDEALEVLVRLGAENDHVLVSCPWGFQKQGSDPSDHEFHHWGPQPADFTSIGFMAEVFGTEFSNGGGHGNLIAWV